MSDKNAGEIRIVKKKKGHGGHHGGAWKVAYADFVTAMMAFFLVMWIVGLSQEIKQSVAGYFQNPVAFMKGVQMGRAPFSVNDKEEGGPGQNKTLGKTTASRKILDRAEAEKEVAKARLAAAKNTIERIIQATPEFKNLKNHIDIKLTDEGLKIELLEAEEALFFDSGSANIKASTRELLQRIAIELGKIPNKVIIEGHTDNRPLASGPSYTNWELSADRANSARMVMQAAGLSRSQVVQVRGYADTDPRDPRHPEHYSNRRVSIVVLTTGSDNPGEGSIKTDTLRSFRDEIKAFGEDAPIVDRPTHGGQNGR